MTDVGASSVHSRGANRHPTRLSCQACQRRKIKCDRDLPCQQCTRNGSQCVPVLNQRLPRGRGGGRKGASEDLASRVAKLEELLTQAQLHTQPREDFKVLDAASSISTQPPDQRLAPSQSQFLGDSFWASLKNELIRLEGQLEESAESSDTTDDVLPVDQTTTDTQDSPSPAGLKPIGRSSGTASPLMRPPPYLAASLCDIYFANVDSFFKLLHAPSVRAHLVDGLPYLDYAAQHHAVASLEFVLYFAAVSTITDDQCLGLFGQPKSRVAQHYQDMAESALGEADYLVSNDLATLQSLVIYLAIMRGQDQTRRTWTLASLAVRTALALGLHNDRSSILTPFMQEQRHRLWYAICVLDLTLAVDLASDALILTGNYDTPRPLNINDADMVFGSSAPIHARQGWTKMTFTAMTHQIAVDAPRAHNLPPDAGQARQDIIRELGENIETQYLGFCSPHIPLQAFTIAVARSAVAACLLHSISPTRAPSRMAGPSINSEQVLLIAIDALSYSQQCHDHAGSFVIWRQWHAMAMAFAALSFITDGPLADRGWEVVEPSLAQFSATVVGGQADRIREHLDGLAAKARQARLRSQTNGDKFSKSASAYQPTTESVQHSATLAGDVPMWEAADWDQLFSDFPNLLDFDGT
ncbi:hypothetical protein LTR17_002751 [Elasticomyces elasticus]|nr:hypothetical protein LTR17_002751 [Elasticomyces elasticus]